MSSTCFTFNRQVREFERAKISSTLYLVPLKLRKPLGHSASCASISYNGVGSHEIVVKTTPVINNL